jgi:hypothetical protein
MYKHKIWCQILYGQTQILMPNSVWPNLKFDASKLPMDRPKNW